MPRLPPAEKLALAVRKGVRDEYESKKEGLEKQLSDKLGVAWTFDINPLAIAPYAGDSNLGYMLHSYADGAVYMLKYFADKQGAEGVAELNAIAHAHTITLDVDEAGTNTYNGCEVKDGKLVILFNEKNFGVNTGQAFEVDKVLAALNAAPPAPGGDGAPKLSFAARNSIRNDYEPKAEEIRQKIVKLLGREDIKLEPNFEGLYATLSANKTKVDSDYESRMGYLVGEYFDGLAYLMQYQKFGEDDMLQEGFNEAVETGIITFRIVDQLKYGSYCEVVIEDGKLYVQSNLDRYGVNTGQAAEKLVDQL
ncbi:hypothetical protein SEUCBS140593_003064 [Sporothrix eucalyptigena]|uniref:Uncharacterized protein n=1 Tax=Sporothrix eucalyptigena TaxID=1812306 RepID=A0ABP0BC08_9PEZI